MMHYFVINFIIVFSIYHRTHVMFIYLWYLLIYLLVLGFLSDINTIANDNSATGRQKKKQDNIITF